MNTTLTLNNKKNPVAFPRIKGLLACRSNNPDDQFLQHVLIESTGKSSMMTASNKHVLRRDRIMKPLDSGIYGVTIDTWTDIKLERLEDISCYPRYKQAIPDLKNQDFYMANGTGPSFVYWAAAALGTYLDSKLINFGVSENIKLYVSTHDSTVPVVAKTPHTTLIIMPLRQSLKDWQARQIMNRYR